VAEHGGNWAGEPNVAPGRTIRRIVHVEVPADREQSLAKALQAMDARGLTVVVHTTNRRRLPRGVRTSLKSSARIGPGLSAKFLIRSPESGVNVEELHTECASAAHVRRNAF